MRARIRLVAVLVAALLPTLLLGHWTLRGGQPLAEIDDLDLPENVGPWTLRRENELAPDVLEMIEPDAYTMRRYVARGRTPVWLYVGLYLGRAGYGRGAHEPEVCYPAQGWEVTRSQPMDVPLEGEKFMHVKLLDVQNSTRHEVVLYWFQPSGRWASSGAVEELTRIVDAALGRPQYAFVRLSGPTHADRDAIRDLIEFAHEIAPAIRANLDGIGREPQTDVAGLSPDRGDR